MRLSDEQVAADLAMIEEEFDPESVAYGHLKRALLDLQDCRAELAALKAQHGEAELEFATLEDAMADIVTRAKSQAVEE